MGPWQKWLRRLAQPILWWLYRWYNRREHWVRMKGLQLCIGPSVFHPRWFLTTRTFTEFAEKTVQVDDKVLELGAGNGLLALCCQRLGAEVVASDINPQAIESLKRSAIRNTLPIKVIQSDLFEQIPQLNFDYIFINPPYFPQNPGNHQESAFFCGEEFNYFQRLFTQLSNYPSSSTFMILTNACDLVRIKSIAGKHKLSLVLLQTKTSWGEEHLIFSLQHNN